MQKKNNRKTQIWEKNKFETETESIEQRLFKIISYPVYYTSV